MKCPVCKGKGTIERLKVFSVADIVIHEKCKNCNGTGEITLTNEEWLEQASTEEKALFLARVYGRSRKINLPELLYRNVGTREVTDVAEYIGKWLKEKHE